MSEAEVIELVAILGSNSFSIFAVYLSITFAYLTVAYFVGASLNRFQVLAISGLYVASAGVTALAMIGTTEAWVTLIAENQTTLSRLRIYSAGIWDNYSAVLLPAGMLVSLYFMYEIRQRNSRIGNGPDESAESHN